MTPLFTVLLGLGGALRDPLRELRAQPERGAPSVEQGIIPLALLGIAVPLLVVFANAVHSRSSQIQ